MSRVFLFGVLIFPFSCLGQLTLPRNLQLLLGINLTRTLPAQRGSPYVLAPGLGWQFGITAQNRLGNSRSAIDIGLVAINRRYKEAQVKSLFFVDQSFSNYLFWNQEAVYYDLELPIVFTHFSSFRNIPDIKFGVGIIPGWRLDERYITKVTSLLPDGTLVDVSGSRRSRFNHKGPFNRLSLYASFQIKVIDIRGNVWFFGPDFRFNILPFFGGGRSGFAPTGSEDETISFGLNVGVLLNKKLKSPER